MKIAFRRRVAVGGGGNLTAVSFDPHRVRDTDWAVGVLGAILLGSMFMPWFGVTGSGAPAGLTADAWQAFAAIDVFVAIAGLMAISLVVFTALHRTAAVPQALSTLTTVMAGVATILILVRALDLPGVGSVSAAAAASAAHVTREFGLWIGLAASLALVVASWRSMTDERFPAAMTPRLEITKLSAPGGE